MEELANIQLVSNRKGTAQGSVASIKRALVTPTSNSEYVAGGKNSVEDFRNF